MTLLIDIIDGVCDFCGCCVGVCPEDAILLETDRIAIIAERCTNCAKCVWVCPFETLAFRNPKAQASEAAGSDAPAKGSSSSEEDR